MYFFCFNVYLVIGIYFYLSMSTLPSKFLGGGKAVHKATIGTCQYSLFFRLLDPHLWQIGSVRTYVHTYVRACIRNTSHNWFISFSGFLHEVRS